MAMLSFGLRLGRVLGLRVLRLRVLRLCLLGLGVGLGLPGGRGRRLALLRLLLR